MLGNCILRDPRTVEGRFDKGALCESLLFFGNTHLVFDFGTLGLLIKDNCLNDVIALMQAGHLTGNYSPQMPAIFNHTENGIRHHVLTVVKVTGDQKKPNKRNADIFEEQLQRTLGDKAAARKYFRQFADLISFKDIADKDVPEMGLRDICDPLIANEVARMALLEKGIPEAELRFSKIDIMPLGDSKFAISTDIDFDKLRQFLPEPDRKEFSSDMLFPSIANARFDIGIAASHNAAFVGNQKNQKIIDLILNRIIGTAFDPEFAKQQLYDFISVSTPSVREVINGGERSTGEFIALMEKATSFRKWVSSQTPTADLVQEMLREKSRTDWLDSLPIKAMRFGLFTAGGAAADSVAPHSSVALGVVDTFIVDQIAKRWRPHYFVENNLRGFLDTDPK